MVVGGLKSPRRETAPPARIPPNTPRPAGPSWTFPSRVSSRNAALATTPQMGYAPPPGTPESLHFMALEGCWRGAGQSHKALPKRFTPSPACGGGLGRGPLRRQCLLHAPSLYPSPASGGGDAPPELRQMRQACRREVRPSAPLPSSAPRGRRPTAAPTMTPPASARPPSPSSPAAGSWRPRPPAPRRSVRRAPAAASSP